MSDAPSVEAAVVKSYAQPNEEEQTQIGGLGVHLATMTKDREDTEESLGQRSEFIAELSEAPQTLLSQLLWRSSPSSPLGWLRARTLSLLVRVWHEACVGLENS